MANADEVDSETGAADLPTKRHTPSNGGDGETSSDGTGGDSTDSADSESGSDSESPPPIDVKAVSTERMEVGLPPFVTYFAHADVGAGVSFAGNCDYSIYEKQLVNRAAYTVVGRMVRHRAACEQRGAEADLGCACFACLRIPWTMLGALQAPSTLLQAQGEKLPAMAGGE